MSKSSTTKEVKIEAVTPVEMKMALSGPALYTNKIYLTRTELGCRMTFAETQDHQDPEFRSAVFMTWKDFLSFKELIKDIDVKMTQEPIQ